MQVRFHHVFPIIVLTLLAGGSFWLERATRVADVADSPDVLEGPDVIVEQMSITRFDINGNPHYYLDAREMKHLPGEQQARLDGPVVHLVRDGLDMRWSSDTAEVRDDSQRVDMVGNVEGERTIPGEAPAHFSSATLTVWPEVESAKSTTPVTLTQNGSVATGDRMDADNIFGVVTLTGRVKVHMPNTRK